jgi:hypothetical protein
VMRTQRAIKSTAFTLLLTAVVTALQGCNTPPDPVWQAEHDEAVGRWREAGRMLAERRYEEATDSLELLWRESTSPPWVPKRPLFYSNLLGSIRGLTEVFAPGRERFLAIEAEQFAAISAGTADPWQERIWLDLNRTLRNEVLLVEYAEIALADPHRRKALAYQDHRAFDRLIEVGRWDLAGYLHDDAVDRIYPEETPLLLRPVEGAAKVAVGIAGAPLWLFGTGMVTSPRGLGPAQKEDAGTNVRWEKERLQRAGVMGAALTAAGRHREAKELYRRAVARMGTEAAEIAFESAARRAGLSDRFEPG